jgi:hypothetical protein
MALEVHEIGIRFSVEGEPEQEGAPAAQDGAARLTARERESLVEECVRAVLEALKRGRER